ncbi:hypothetical protein NGA_0074500 [Nannochloropsis gaditana CCMP526]|uniref:uncharacterized protein n=1 Tax=Nannochloropsis gaditana (strain CCMP526) TaxID=1093141 RepID=UPI00029F58C0|nr:hypothetical protein NGA_0074500 [Nannochloropsis gaditana CCMP526]EKU21088.1 hypothetical protein NGA_0074500 [Nannochloropsis gaditana CCMP526]|eukprot:XP_005855263.1 hypothetical protein NGA_0074500 [Nannochloropsis gaditana CCMP526]
MLGVVRGIAARVKPAKNQAQLISRRMMGGDGGHHPHYVFEPPFNKTFVAVLVGGGVTLGTGLVVASWKFQNKKQGFTK